jgi:hypothetical protein
MPAKMHAKDTNSIAKTAGVAAELKGFPPSSDKGTTGATIRPNKKANTQKAKRYGNAM